MPGPRWLLFTWPDKMSESPKIGVEAHGGRALQPLCLCRKEKGVEAICSSARVFLCPQGDGKTQDSTTRTE